MPNRQIPGTLKGFAFRQPGARVVPEYILSAQLGYGSFTLTGRALVSAALSIQLQKGAFAETGIALASAKLGATMQRGLFSETGEPVASARLSITVQRGVFALAGFPIGPDRISDQLQAGHFVLRGFPLGGGIPAASAGGGPPWQWLLPKKRKEERELQPVGAPVQEKFWLERVIIRTPKWWDAIVRFFFSFAHVFTVKDEAAIEVESKPDDDLKQSPSPVPWRTPEDLVAALQGALARKTGPWRPPPDLADAILKTIVRTDSPSAPSVKPAPARIRTVTIDAVRQTVRLMDAAERERKASTFKNYVRIPLPLENKLARSVEIAHEELFEGLVTAATELGAKYGYRYAGKGVLVQDRGPEDFIRELAELVGKRGPEVEALRARINAQFVAAERAWLAQFLERGDPRARQILLSLALDKDAVFADKILALRRLYLDDAMERVLGEQDDLKASFLLKLIQWAEGKAETLDVSELVGQMKEQAGNKAHNFARDQFSRFERSLTLSSFEAAEAPYVEVFNSNDVRVRGVPEVQPSESHRNWPEGWGRAIFTREGLLNDPRWGSYNCRCGFVPRWELTAEQRTRLIA